MTSALSWHRGDTNETALNNYINDSSGLATNFPKGRTDEILSRFSKHASGASRAKGRFHSYFVVRRAQAKFHSESQVQSPASTLILSRGAIP